MRFGSVCSGIEAASVAWSPLGWKAAWFAEIEPFPSAVLAHHYPHVPNLGDMTTIARRVLSGEVEAPDLLCGGTPCQAFSVAGLRKSLDDDRGNLTLKFVELADAIDHVRARAGLDPADVFWENVPGVLSTKDNAFGCFLAGLAGEADPLVPPGGKWSNAGAVLGPQRAVAWRVLDAQYFGVAQRRRRVFVVASASGRYDPATVLFEWDGVRRDTPPSRQAGKDAASGTLRSTDGGSDVDHVRAGHIQPVAGTLTAAFGRLLGQSGQDADHGHSHLVPDTTHTLRGEGFDASEDGTGRGTPLIPVGVTIHGTDPSVQKVASYDDLAQCLRARTPGNIDNSSTTVVQHPIGFQTRGSNVDVGDIAGTIGTNADRASGSAPMVCFDTTQVTSPANRSNPKPGDPCHPLAAGAHPPAIAFDCKASGMAGFGVGEIASTMRAMGHAGSHSNGGGQLAVAVALRGREGGATAELGDEVQNCLRASSGGGDKPHVLTAMQVRRLTPVECERLQGFPDGYTAIPWRNKPASECPDGPRYKALGNSWATNVVRWLGNRLAKAKRLEVAA